MKTGHVTRTERSALVFKTVPVLAAVTAKTIELGLAMYARHISRIWAWSVGRGDRSYRCEKDKSKRINCLLNHLLTSSLRPRALPPALLTSISTGWSPTDTWSGRGVAYMNDS